MSAPPVEIRPATAGDAVTLVLRAADREEVEALTGRDPRAVLVESVERSASAWAGVANGELVCLFGVVPMTLAGVTGVPWLLGSDAVARYGAADGVNVKLAKSGGPIQALMVADRAIALGLDAVVGCMMESTVGVAAAAAVAAVLDAHHGARVHDLDAGLWLATPAGATLRYVRDTLVSHAGPGIGEVLVPPRGDA